MSDIPEEMRISIGDAAKELGIERNNFKEVA
jgi:hypothetical protein